MDPDINNVLEANEKIVWQGIINRKVLNVLLIISLVIILGISFVLISINSINYTSNGQPKQMSGFIFGISFGIIGLLISFLAYFSNRIKNFAITQKRVLIKSGLIGTDFKSVYFDQIKNIIVDVGIIGKIFNVGTIKIDIGEMETYSSSSGSNRIGTISTRVKYSTLAYIDNPYDVYKYLQKTLVGNKESLYSGRADRESNPQAYKK